MTDGCACGLVVNVSESISGVGGRSQEQCAGRSCYYNKARTRFSRVQGAYLRREYHIPDRYSCVSAGSSSPPPVLCKPPRQLKQSRPSQPAPYSPPARAFSRES
ncbi:uncharacterized protein LAJ45_08395 [Morchella importuna]|uniref:uncharacterized protein n=1 Tax=Morchella importuna TaxID=1174673 RepID=UPI001E8D7523|nr:uncharacterized protein LAJ45_08395 [Morchella importuna]KAH8147568.1 hypothetical protein LAJ45_08395 [Morchella importuna]